MDQQVLLVIPRQGDHLRLQAAQADPLVAVPAEDQRFAVLQLQRASALSGGGVVERPIVEDHAVLIDLDERCSAVLGRPLQDHAEVLWWTLTVRATKVASQPMATERMWSGLRSSRGACSW